MSVEETFGKVTAEALSCGTPSVVFNSTANPELIGEGCGYVVEPKDVDGVLQKLKQIENDGKKAYTERCREFIVTEMNKETTLSEFIEVYKELLKK
jgi:glycosyltransferase involved in cell wall biosynthesis